MENQSQKRRFKIVSDTTPNKSELNDIYNEFLDEFREYKHSHPTADIGDYSFDMPKRGKYVTKKVLQEAKEAVQKVKELNNQPDYEIIDDFSEQPANDDVELIANIRQELQQGTNTRMCNLMEAILDTTIGEDYDGLIERLYGVEEYALDLASTVAFDSNPGNILNAAERLAELITGSQQYNQEISDELQVWKKENPTAHSTSSSRARNDDY